MKNVTTVAILMLFLFCCFPGKCVEYTIENKTDKDLELITFPVDSSKGKVAIKFNSILTELKTCYEGGGDVLSYDGYDSIQVKASGVLVKTYYPNDKGKSLFKTSTFLHGEEARYSWKLVEFKRNYEKYVFEITEEDLK